jgi:hypothetical protein
MVSSSVGLESESDSAGEAQQILYESIADPFSRQRGRPILKKCKCLMQISEERRKLFAVPSRWPDTRTDRPTDRRS